MVRHDSLSSEARLGFFSPKRSNTHSPTNHRCQLTSDALPPAYACLRLDERVRRIEKQRQLRKFTAYPNPPENNRAVNRMCMYSHAF